MSESTPNNHAAQQPVQPNQQPPVQAMPVAQQPQYQPPAQAIPVEQSQPQSPQAMPIEQQQYLQVLAQKKRLFTVSEAVQDSMNTAMESADDPRMMRVIQKLDAADKITQATISNLYYQQKVIESKHPEYKAQAVQHAKNREKTQAAQHSQNYAQNPAQTQVVANPPQQSF